MKPKPLTGQGRPPRDLKAALGQKYRDEFSGKTWVMTAHGWEMASFLHIDVLVRQKSNWVAAAKSAGKNLEDWVIGNLDACADQTIH